MKIRRFDRRTFARKAVVNSVAATSRARLEMRVVAIDTQAPNARPKDQDAQLQAQTSSSPQQR